MLRHNWQYSSGCNSSHFTDAGPEEQILAKRHYVEFVGEAQEDKKAVEKIINGQVQLVYISPENLLENRRYRNMLRSTVYQEKMIALVVGEALCVKFW